MKENPRATAPLISTIQKINFPIIQAQRMVCGADLYAELHAGYEVCKLQLSFLAGRPQEAQRLSSRFAAMMLKEGTTLRSSEELAELFDEYGASIQTSFTLDRVYLTLYCLSRHLDILIPVLVSLINDSNFPDDELARLKEQSQQKLLYDLAKPDIVSYRKVTEMLFGESHPYGYNSSEEDIAKITRDSLLEHYGRTIRGSVDKIYVAGHVQDHHIEILDSLLGPQRVECMDAKDDIEMLKDEHEAQVTLPGMEQMSIRLGRKTFAKRHEDYMGLSLLNTILGGYFGSRLMSQIRENMGLTYGIHSSLESYATAGCLLISADVNEVNHRKALDAIKAEMIKLQEHLIPDEELDLVRNYIKGILLGRSDGAFKRIRSVINVVENQLSLDYYDRYLDYLERANSTELRDLARIYLNPTDYYQVIVGDLG